VLFLGVPTTPATPTGAANNNIRGAGNNPIGLAPTALIAPTSNLAPIFLSSYFSGVFNPPQIFEHLFIPRAKIRG
jgi:hypothetical protein